MAVQTVLGRIERRDLGIITPHEHIMIDLSSFFQAHPLRDGTNPSTAPVIMEHLGILSRDPYALRSNLILDDPEVQTEELRRFYEAGGRTVIDATMPGIGRNPLLMRQISRETGLNVIIGTGYYVGATHPECLAGMTIEEITAAMVRELTIGIDDTGIRAGYIGEIGISEIFDDKERRVLKAAAQAQLATGVAVHVHINPWTTNGLEASGILLEAGVRPDRINICHVDVENRETYIMELLNRGLYIEFDNFGKEFYVNREVRNPGYGLFASDLERVRLVKKLIDLGYIDQLLLSCDVCLKNLLHTYGGWGYDHILTNIVPMMEDEGITDRQIEQMLQDNPARFIDVPAW
ncbi:MAG: hypothetical protein VB070_03855 [Clostridiaceae bacterium]|nr:hypothetical protein [Clostridiaceae bacterium]